MYNLCYFILEIHQLLCYELYINLMFYDITKFILCHFILEI